MDKGYYEFNQMRKNYSIKVVPHEEIKRDVLFCYERYIRNKYYNKKSSYYQRYDSL